MGETDKSNEENLEHDNRNARERKRFRIVLLIILLLVLFPMIALSLNHFFGWNFGELYTLGLELKDFLTLWIALGGVIGVAVNIFMSQTRIDQQKEQIAQQKGQFDKQQKFQQTQFDEQQKLQLKEQRDARFASGVELLGNPHESTRIGGAYNLYFLAREFPDDYLNPVCEILCAHLRSIAHKDKFQTEEQREKYPRNEVQTIIDLLFKEREGRTIFEVVKWKIMSQIFLSDINFEKAKLSNVGLRGAELNHVRFFYGGNLTDVVFSGAELTDVVFSVKVFDRIDFSEAKLSKDVVFTGVPLSYVVFYDAKLNDVVFEFVELDNVNFSKARIKGDNTFAHTCLKDYSLEEIVKPGRSRELTSKKEE